MRLLHCAFLFVLVAIGTVRTAGRPQADTVDAAVFLLAFRDGHADQYKGKTIAGSGLDFNGSTPRLMLTVGAAGANPPPAAVTTWEQFHAAQDARRTLIVALDAAAFRRTSWPRVGQPPDEYTFSGVFNGTTMTVPRMGSRSSAPDSGPCETPQPENRISVGNAPRTVHCVPVLEQAVVQKR